MTTDIKKLVERLRVAEVGEAFQTEDGSPELQRTELGLDAADALEAMAGARAECERQYQAKVEEVIAQMNRAEAAESERDRLAGEVEGLKQSLIIMSDKRCDAVAERDRLAGEVATVRSARDMHHANYELMKAHNKELFGKLSAAEAERDRLKAALEAFVKHFGPLQDNHMLHGDVRNCYRLARKALGGDAS